MSMLHRIAPLARTIAAVRRGAACRPRMLTYTVTFACNARCVMCDSWRKSSMGDLSLAEIERIFLRLPELDVVRLTGGEPFVRRDLTDIAQIAVNTLEPALLHVTTNGFLTDRIVDFCERRPRSTPLALLVSIDGIGETHDAIRGHRGAYRAALRTLEALAARRKELRLSLAVNQTVVNAAGARQYRDLHATLAPLGIANHVVVAYRSSATYSVAPDTVLAPGGPGEFEPFEDIPRAVLERLFDALADDLNAYAPAERAAKRYYLDGIRNRLLARKARPNPPCVALRAHLRMFPNGDVPICQFNSRRLGNLRERSFEDLWFDERAQSARRWVRACPGCWAECEVLPSAVYSADLFAHALMARRPAPRAQRRPA